MFINGRLGFSLVFLASFSAAASAQAPSLPTPAPADRSATNQPASDMINLDVVVTPKSGPPVSGLQQQDFTVLDNKVPQTIQSFHAVREREAPIEIVLLIDDVNTGIANIAYERSELDKFLRTDGGHLAHPIALAFLADSGLKLQDDFSSDGNALSTALDQYTLGLHSILRSGGVYSAVERFQVSVNALLQLATHEAARPGRKMIVWISPGWPILSSPTIEQQMTAKQEQQIFDNVVKISTLLREGRVTLYSIDPLGSADFGGRSFHWEAYSKGLSKLNQADWGNLALQVIATQSGGLALMTGNDITAYVQQCVADTQAYYEISFTPALDQKRDEYHRLEVRMADRKLTARTRQGYYSNPSH